MKFNLNRDRENLMNHAFFAVVDGEAGGDSGKIGVGEIQTVQNTNAESPDLIVNDVDKIITKVRPQSNPLVMVATRVPATTSTTQEFGFYEMDTLPDETTVKTQTTEGKVVEIDTNNNDMFSPKETIFFEGVDGYDEDGVTKTPYSPLWGYVEEVTPNSIKVKPINGKGRAENMKLPVIPQGTRIIRGGRAHNELDIQTSPHALFPAKRTQYIQRFKCQVEESTASKIANKEVPFTLSDQEEEAIFDMTRGISKNIICGVKRRIFDASKREVYLTGGIWGMIGKDYLYGSTSSTAFTKEDFINISKEAFVGSNGSKRKTMFCGSEFLSRLSALDLGNNVEVTTKERFDLTFNVLKTNFGILEVIYDETMDSVGKSDCAMILDLDFIRRKDLAGVEAKRNLDFKSSGEKNADGRVITRAFALYLQNVKTHIRVIPRK